MYENSHDEIVGIKPVVCNFHFHENTEHDCSAVGKNHMDFTCYRTLVSS